jgi:UDP-glucuronate 4-epimerase
MKILVTGAAGFIGFHTAKRLLERGDEVIGIDSLNAYYSQALKEERLAQLAPFPRFSFREMDVAAEDFGGAIKAAAPDVDLIVHLAAQAGVRYSVENPRAYVEANVTGQVSIFELAASLPARPPVVYASSSSVYGAQQTVPYAESARADQPVSVYAATKRAGELLAHAYGELHGIASTGLRFFTVYGRYGRPDMAPWLFTDAILAGRPIQVFDNGAMERDFTHVDDIVAGVVAAADRIVERPKETEPVYNLGNNRPVKLLDFIAAIEEAAGRKAIMEMKPRPKGDVPRTFADITLAQRDLGFAPKTLLADGIADFVGWYAAWRQKNA